MKKIVFFALFITQAFAQKNLFDFPLGVQAWTFRNHWKEGVAKTLDTIQKLGFTELEGNAPEGYTGEQFRQLCLDRGITIPSTGCSYDQLKTDPQKITDAAKILGAKYVMCAWIPHKGDVFTLEETKQAVEVFNKAGKVLADNGLIFCYHDHGYEFQANGKDTYMDYLIQNTNPAYVSFEMDVLWTLHGGGATSPEKLLKKYGNRWKLMHVKDLKKGIIGDKTGHAPAEHDVALGTGQANWKKILTLSKKVGIQHYFIEDESNQEMINIPKSLEYLKSL